MVGRQRGASQETTTIQLSNTYEASVMTQPPPTHLARLGHVANQEHRNAHSVGDQAEGLSTLLDLRERVNGELPEKG